MTIHYYYLHTNGDLICKRFYPDPSDFVKKIWTFNTKNRESAWTIILESLALGANHGRIKELCEHWKTDLKDLPIFMAQISRPTDELKDGLETFLEKIHNKDYDEWMNWLARTPSGQKPNFDNMP